VDALQSASAELYAIALAYPGAVLDTPWGERVVKVAKRIFVFAGVHEGRLRVTCKLPRTRDAAMLLPFASPTGYNLGPHGWVTATFEAGDDPPVGLLAAWIDESYRAVAPKKLVALLDAASPAKETASRSRSKPRAARKKRGGAATRKKRP